MLSIEPENTEAAKFLKSTDQKNNDIRFEEKKDYGLQIVKFKD